ncbi:hypothetical protein [Sutterella sp.]|uniref:hypothetical protein n=1 Tax=Sutterella sp. TaxID=1981025 RepID=UPI0026DFA841|nr:hypothetical protein [Sutterella sp.]MDO5531054.1 hypothetical protein [Sutterella sp.]
MAEEKKTKRRGNPQYLRVPTSEQAREYGRRGGLASARKFRERKQFREVIQEFLDSTNIDDPTKTNREVLVDAMFNTAMAGDVRAFIALRDTAGEKPVEERREEHSGGIEISWAEPGEIKEEE